MSGNVLDHLLSQATECRRRGDLIAAEQLFSQAVQLDPTSGAAWLRLGAFHLDCRRLDLAEPALMRAISLQPDDARAQNSLGVLRGLQRRHTEAVAAFRAAIAADPALVIAHFHLGCALYELE